MPLVAASCEIAASGVPPTMKNASSWPSAMRSALCCGFSSEAWMSDFEIP